MMPFNYNMWTPNMQGPAPYNPSYGHPNMGGWSNFPVANQNNWQPDYGNPAQNGYNWTQGNFWRHPNRNAGQPWGNARGPRQHPQTITHGRPSGQAPRKVKGTFPNNNYRNKSDKARGAHLAKKDVFNRKVDEKRSPPTNNTKIFRGEGNIPAPRNTIRKRALINEARDYSPPNKRAKITTAQRRGNIPASRTVVNKIKKRYIHLRTKRFDNEEWRKHNKLAILTFQLAQIEFHINTWKSAKECKIHERINDLCENIKPPRMNSRFLNRMDHTRNMITEEITNVMMDHLITEHNEVVGDIIAYKPLVMIKKEILDTALRKLTSTKKHERWDDDMYHGFLRKVRNFLIYDDNCSLLSTYNNEGQPEVLVPTEANINAQSDPLVNIILDNTGDEGKISPPVESINKITRKRVRMEEGTTPIPPRNRNTSNDSIGALSGDILGTPPEKITYNEGEISYSPIVDDDLRDPFSSPLDLTPVDEDPELIQQNGTALVLFRAMVSLANSSVTNAKDVRLSTEALLKMAFTNETIQVPLVARINLSGPTLTELAQAVKLKPGPISKNLNRTSCLLTKHITANQFRCTPKVHREKKIYEIFSSIFCHEPWWKRIERSFPFLTKGKKADT